mgnify:CR=1 FL=1
MSNLKFFAKQNEQKSKNIGLEPNRFLKLAKMVAVFRWFSKHLSTTAIIIISALGFCKAEPFLPITVNSDDASSAGIVDENYGDQRQNSEQTP